jgi:RNA:NAD 2'-phosphotransferase (TPT1/KptA family)
MMGADIAITLLLGLLDRAAVIGSVINAARTEGRDLTQAEIDLVVAADDKARNELVAAIEKAKGG